MKAEKAKMSKKIKKFVLNRHSGGHLTAASKLFCGKALYLLLILFLSIALFAGLIFTVGGGSNGFLQDNQINVSAVSSTPNNTSGSWITNNRYASGFAGGSGTESDPYQIATAAQLAYLSYTIANNLVPYQQETSTSGDNITDIWKRYYSNKYFVLTANIDLSAYYWEPIGWMTAESKTNGDTDYTQTTFYAFSGSFDGQDYEISGLCLTPKISTNENIEYKGRGLFGCIVGTSRTDNIIQNIRIVDSYIETTEDYFGSIVGWVDVVTVKNCYNSSQISGGSYVGGLFGRAAGANIYDCINEGVVNGSYYVGGIAGNQFSSSSISMSFCSNSGQITGHYGVGGIAGIGFRIYDCFNTGSINQTANSASSGCGGIAGNAASSTSIIERCYNSGQVASSGKHTGGILGYASLAASQYINIYDCYNTGKLSGDDAVGGIVGEAREWAGAKISIARCYNTGSISGSSQIGGIAGIIYKAGGDASISQCLNIGSVSGSSHRGAILGEDDLLLFQKMTFTNNRYGGASSNISPVDGGSQSGCTMLSTLDTDMKTQEFFSTNYSTWDFGSVWEFRPSENEGYPVFKRFGTKQIIFDPQGGNINLIDVEGLPYSTHFYFYNHTYTYSVNGLKIDYDTSSYFLKINSTTFVNNNTNLPSAILGSLTAGDIYRTQYEYVSGENGSGVGIFVIEAGNASFGNISTRNYSDIAMPLSGQRNGAITISTAAQTEGAVIKNWFWNGEVSSNFSSFKDYTIRVTTTNETHAGQSRTIEVDDYMYAVSVPYKDGAIFKGYYTSPNGEGTCYFDEYGRCINQPREDVVLYAYWEDTWLMHAASSFAGGSGTQSAPYEIATAEQLALLTYNVYNGVGAQDGYVYVDTYFKQIADIDLSTYPWVPIGVYYNLDGVLTDFNFAGNFDGGGYTISGIELVEVTGEAYNRRGLFGRVNGEIGGGEIKNINITNSNITGGSYVGGLVGYAGANAIITNCSVNATVTGSSDYVGGIVGNSVGTSVTSCMAQGAVTGGGSTGGIMGEGSAQISNCYNTASVKGSPAGGIVGNGSAYVSYSYNYGLVSANKPNYEAGGIAGINLNMIQYCGNYAKVSGLSSSSIGGIVGVSDGCDVYYCTNTGDVLGSGVSTAGGIVGHLYDGDVVACYNSASSVGDSQTSSTSATGGIVGGMEDACIISGCASSSVLTGMSVGGIVGAVNSGSHQIQQCVYTGIIKVTASYTMIGGIVGVILEDCEILIDLCFVKAIMLNTLADDANTYAGGIVGVVVPALDIGFAKISRSGAVVGTISGLLDTESSIIKIYPFACNTATGYNMPVESSYSIISNPQDPDNGYGYVAYAEEYEQPFDGSFGVNIDKYGWESFASGEPLDTISSVEIGLPLPIGTYAIAQFGSTDGGDIIMRVEEFAGAIGQPVTHVNTNGSYT